MSEGWGRGVLCLRPVALCREWRGQGIRLHLPALMTIMVPKFSWWAVNGREERRLRGPQDHNPRRSLEGAPPTLTYACTGGRHLGFQSRELHGTRCGFCGLRTSHGFEVTGTSRETEERGGGADNYARPTNRSGETGCRHSHDILVWARMM